MQKDGDNKDRWNANNNRVYDKKVENEDGRNWFKCLDLARGDAKSKLVDPKGFFFLTELIIVTQKQYKTIMLT